MHDITQYDKCWGRLCKVLCDCVNLRQWDTIGHTEIARFLPVAQNIVSTSVIRPGTTRGWEWFLVDTLHVQYGMFASPWSSAART